MMDKNIGKIYKSNNYGHFVVEEKIENKYLVRFLSTGYSKLASSTGIYNKSIRDPFYPTYFEVGYTGNVKPSTYPKEYKLWYGILQRCYNPESIYYYAYGGAGVYVCNRWLSLEHFIHDMPLIEGYDKHKFYDGLLHLDKDIKAITTPKYYSLETCKFVDQKTNYEDKNIRLKKRTSSQYRGVTKLKDGMFQVILSLPQGNKYIGRYRDEKYAAAEYIKARQQYLNI